MRTALIEKTLTEVTAQMSKEEKKWKKDLRKGIDRGARDYVRKSLSLKRRTRKRVTLKSLCYENMEEAIRLTSDDGKYPFSNRQLFYTMRRLVANEARRITDRRFTELKKGHFNGILLDWQLDNYKIEGMYYEIRGLLFECHSNQTFRAILQIGTRQEASYVLPETIFNKVLYIEKRGVLPILQQEKIPEKYDMAILAGEGEATVAIRKFFKRCEAKHFDLFCLHDADVSGYDIARVCREETERMKLEIPGYSCDVIDIGLFLEEAIETLELEEEEYTPTKKIIAKVHDRLTPYEEDKWTNPPYVRVELNAMTPAQLIKYIDERISKYSKQGKVIPSQKDLTDEGQQLYDKLAKALMEKIINQALGIDDTIAKVQKRYSKQLNLSRTRRKIVTRLKKEPTLWWKTVLKNIIRNVFDQKEKDLIKFTKAEVRKASKSMKRVVEAKLDKKDLLEETEVVIEDE